MYLQQKECDVMQITTQPIKIKMHKLTRIISIYGLRYKHFLYYTTTHVQNESVKNHKRDLSICTIFSSRCHTKRRAGAHPSFFWSQNDKDIQPFFSMALLASRLFVQIICSPLYGVCCTFMIQALAKDAHVCRDLYKYSRTSPCGHPTTVDTY